ncbi:Chitinase 1 [Tulasnella sp. 424]|nr:Chitinase 1 [Tulasnella sp. 424]
MTCNSNLVTFWGQNSYGAVNPSDTGNWQKTLAYYCQDDSIDAFPIAFVDEYFSTGGLPHIDLSSTCSVSSNGAFTGTNLANCSFLASDIHYCQSKGKLVTISLGGQNGASSFSGDTQAQQFADTIWNLFLGGSSTTRPFGDVFLDGVDLDIENGSSSYTAFVNRLRSHFTGASKKYYITATPQCPYPDAALSATLNSASFDAVQIQFYNNYCNLASYGTDDWNYAIWDYWARYVSPNKNVKLYIGGPAASGAAGSGYVPTAGLQTIVQDTWKNFPAFFGGVMFWDASQAYANGRYDKSTKAMLKSGEVCTSKGQTVTYQKCTAAAWSSASSYNGGSEVSYQGYQWSAKYWTADPPVGTDETNVWKALFASQSSLDRAWSDQMHGNSVDVIPEAPNAQLEHKGVSPIDLLPVELSHSIILLCLPEVYFSDYIFAYYHQLFTIQHVSSRWFKAVNSCAAAWTNLSSHIRLQALTPILSRSGNQFLGIDCVAESGAACWGDGELRFIDRLKPLASRWKVLNMESNIDNDFITCLRGLTLPNLVELRIYGASSSAPRWIRIENHLPRLSILEVTGVLPRFPRHITVSSAAVVNIIGRDTDVVAPLEHLIRNVSSVQNLHLHCITAETHTTKFSRIYLPRLTSLVMVEAIENILPAFLDNLDAPALRNFELTISRARDQTHFVAIGIFAGRCLAQAQAPLQAESPLADILNINASRSGLRAQYGQHWVNIYHSVAERPLRIQLFNSLFEQVRFGPCSGTARVQIRPNEESNPSELLEIVAQHCPLVKGLAIILTRGETNAIELSADVVRTAFHDIAGYLAKPGAAGTWPFRYMEDLCITLVPELGRIPWGVQMTDKGCFINHHGAPVDICFLDELVGIARSRKMSEPDVNPIREVKAAFGRMSREGKRELERLVSDVELYAVTVTRVGQLQTSVMGKLTNVIDAVL